jgi:undecaprenyl-diphosphatase
VSAGHGEISLPVLIAIVWACALTGDLTSFTLGRRLGRGFIVRHGPRVGITEPRLEQAEQFFAAHGGKTIIIGRFLGFVRPLSPFIAGASKMPARRFIPITTIAAGIWAGTFAVLGYLFWQSLDNVIAITERGTFALLVTVVVTIAAIVAFRHFGEQRRGSRPERPARHRQTPAPAEGD